MFSTLKKIVFFCSFIFSSQLITLGQCAMCKATAENGSKEAVEGLNQGILYLMILPYILIGGIVVAIIVTIYKRRQLQRTLN